MEKNYQQLLELTAKGRFKPTEPIVNYFGKIGRNEECPCGSGKKYKKCCLLTENELLGMETSNDE